MKVIKRFIIGIFVFLMILIIIMGSGGSQMGASKSTSVLFDTLAKEYGLAIDGHLTSQQAESIIDALDPSDKELKLIHKTLPYSVVDLKTFLGAERKSYGSGVIQGEVRAFQIIEDYDYKNSNAYLDDREVTDVQISTQELYQQKDLEYDYRVPWQLITAFRFMTKEKMDADLYRAMLSDFVYAVPYTPFEHSIFDVKALDMNPHIPADNKRLYVPISSDFQPLPSVPLSTNRKYIRVNGIQEVTTETTKWVYKYRRNKDGKRVSRLDNKDKDIVRDIKVEMATPRPLVIRSYLGDHHYKYKREQVIRKRIDYDYNVSKYYDNDGDLRKKVITRKTVYLTSDKMVEDGEQLKADKTKYIDFFTDNNFHENDAVFLLNLMSLLPGSDEMASKLSTSFDNEGVLYMKSGMNRSVYSYIKLKPSELELPIPRFFQNDSRWSSLPFGGSTVGRAGCGPTSFSMVLTGLTGNVVTPPEMCQIAANGGFKTSEGLAWSFFKWAGNRYNLEVEELYPTAKGNQEMVDLLSQGHPVIVSVHEGHFTSAGHIIVLTGVTTDGKIEVNDPYDPHMTKNRAWSPSIIFDEANVYFVIKNPDVQNSDVQNPSEEEHDI